jgi:membrane fusion protein (multidrug efflux system)
MQATKQSEKIHMENNTSKKKNKKKLVIISGILSTILAIAIIYFIIGANYETTDNAQLDADIVPVKSSVSGYIKTVHFKDNEHIKKGQLLITIDDVELKTKVAQAKAALENAKANFLSVKSNAMAVSQNADASKWSSSSVEQNVNSAKAKLTKSQGDFNRIESMFSSKAATQSQLDAYAADLEIAKAQYEGAVNQFKSASAQSQGNRSQAEAQKAQITLAEALVKQREAELALSQTQLDNATIESPSDGIVTKRAVEAGQYIVMAQPLCSIIDNSHLWVTANFKETQVKNIKPGMVVDVEIDAFPDIKITGSIESFIGATGSKFSLLPPDNSTGNFVKIIQRIPVRIELTDYPKGRIDDLFPGLSVFVEVKVK